ncbi:hypothetical protein GGF39_002589 [Coemansia sp. RSA 1721]|nr:hypothetical protein GGF39_002589 [Coemansia sp. RSA 1721]
MPLDGLEPVPIKPVTQCRLLRQLENGNLLSLNMYEETAESISDLRNNNNNMEQADEATRDILGPYVLQAIRRKQLISKRFYDICDPAHVDNTTQGASQSNSRILGRVVSNSVGTIYSVLVSADSSSDDKSRWTEVGSILYEVNILGKKGPRKMTVLVYATGQTASSRDTRSLAERYKQNEDDPSVIVLCNRIPEWCEESEAYVLDFGGRVRIPSVKNFQLVHPEENDYMVLQFGRVGQNSFTLDLKFPMTPLLALGIAVSSMDRKLACS